VAVGAAQASVADAPVRPSLRLRWRARTSQIVAALAVVIVLAAALRLHDLGARSLWIDELFSVGLAVQDAWTTLVVLNGEEANMTLYYVILHLWLGLVGVAPLPGSEVWVRLPSVAFGLVSVWALYKLGAEVDSPMTGLLAALLAAVNAYHVEMSREARSYTLWAALASLSWLALLRALDGGGRKVWTAYVVCTALAFYAHFFTAFGLLAQVVYVALRRRWSELQSFALSGVGVALLCLPFAPFFMLNHDGSQILHVRRSGPPELLEMLRLFAGGTTPVLAAYAMLACSGATTAAWRARKAGHWLPLARQTAPLLWLLVPILTLFALSYVKPMFKERYLFAAMPAFPLAAAVGLAGLRWPLLKGAAGIVVIGLSLAPIINGFSIRPDENWRAAVQYLVASAEHDDGWIFISKRGQLGYEYYAGRLAGWPASRARQDVLEGFDWFDLAASQAYYRALESGTTRLPAFAAHHSRIWLVLAHEFDSTFEGDTSTAVRDWLTRHGYGARQRTFQGIRVLLYERRA